MKEFTTAVNDVVADEENDEDLLEFQITRKDADGEVLDTQEIRCWRPGDGQLAMLMTSLGRHTTVATRIAGIIDFMVGVMDEESHEYIVGRLLDREDEFGLEQVQEIVEWMTEEWTGRPTQRSSASMRSQRTAGRKSTQPTPV